MELHAFEILAQETADFSEDSCPLQSQPRQVFPDVTPPGMSYVPYQLWSDNVYDSQTGLSRGTLFPALDFPFSSAGGDCS